MEFLKISDASRDHWVDNELLRIVYVFYSAIKLERTLIEVGLPHNLVVVPVDCNKSICNDLMDVSFLFTSIYSLN